MKTRTLRSLWQKSTKQLNRRRKNRALALEPMERRELMAATLSLADGLLRISADSQGSTVTITDHNPANLGGAPHLLTVSTISRDGGWAMPVSKHSVREIEFHGSSNRDVYVARTGLTPINTIIRQTVRGWGGDDYLATGMGNDDIRGFFGNDEIHAGGGNDVVDAGPDNDVVYGGSGNDDLKGDFGRDRLFGEDGHDTLQGASGYDDLYGGLGDDVLRGGNDPDLLEGSDGNDQLFGEGSNDFLYGEAGQDGLYGGSGSDLLHGGSGPDRFLVKTNETGPFTQTFGSTAISLLDQILDDTNEDIRIRFTDEAARTVTWPPGYSPRTTSFGTGTWTDADVAMTDDAFEAMATATGSNALLYKPNGAEPSLFRLGDASNQYVAFNDSGTGDTHYSNQSFTVNGVRNENWGVQVVLHEFGHNWDTPEESRSLIAGWGPAAVDAFRARSGWTQARPADTTNYRLSRDGQWWYRSDAQFVRDYARTNPFEDYAESFSAYFMNRMGRTFVFGDGAAAAPGKMDVMASWVTLVSWLGAAGQPVSSAGTRTGSSASSVPIPQPVSAENTPVRITVAARHDGALADWGRTLEDQVSTIVPINWRSAGIDGDLLSPNTLAGILFPVFRPKVQLGR